jgi:multidrug resistance protein MdtO
VATLPIAQTRPAPIDTWARRIWLDVQPTPGRLGGALRIVLASILTLILLEVWQMPFTGIALYFVFLVGRDSPSVSLRSGLFSLLTLTAAVATELAVVSLTDNDPMARVLSVAIVSYIAGMIVVSSTVPTLGSTWGFIFCTLIALWERHAPADRLVETSLYLLGSIGISVCCSVFVEYLFASRDPASQLEEERHMRYRSLVTLYSLHAQGAAPAALHEATVRVARLAAAGQSGMQRLYNTIVDRNLTLSKLPIGTRVRIPMLAQLMDVSAAFAFQQTTSDDPDVRERCAQIASECQAILDDNQPELHGYQPYTSELKLTLLDRVEGILHVIASMPNDSSPTRDKELVALPAKKVPLLIPGAFRQRSTWQFGFKISLCATLCYIVYFALDWPGISTSVTTVLIAGLSTTGALKQRMAFRVIGGLVGGLILGLGCTVFLFPEMDSITSLAVLTAILAFGAAWITGGRQFNYVGLQIIFSFYLVAFEDFHAPTQLAPPRDRLIGILLALLVMWVVFDQLWPVRTVTAMRRAFASILSNEADLFRAEVAHPAHEELIRQTDALRDHIGKTMASIRTLNDSVQYEFSRSRQQHIDTAEQILRAALTAVALIWNELAVLHKEEDADFLTDPCLIELRNEIARQLEALEAIILKGLAPQEIAGPLPDYSFQNPTCFVSSDILDHPRYGEYVKNTLARCTELQALVAGLAAQL